MKKYVIIFLLLHVTNRSVARPKFGMLGDVNLSKIYISDAKTDIDWMSSTLFHFGYSFGATGKFSLSETLNLQTSFFYSQRGTCWDNSMHDLPTTRFNLNYLVVETVLGIHLTDKFELQLGPQFGYLLSATQHSPDNTGDISSAFKTTDLLAVAGINYKFKKSLELSLRYIYGLADINNNTPFMYSSGTTLIESIPKEYNRLFSLTICYFINKKRH